MPLLPNSIRRRFKEKEEKLRRNRLSRPSQPRSLRESDLILRAAAHYMLFDSVAAMRKDSLKSEKAMGQKESEVNYLLIYAAQ